MTAALPWVAIGLLAVAVGWYVFATMRLERELRRRRERLLRADEDLELLRCEFWRKIGPSEHRAFCRRCMGQRERAQA